jgi:hypothetical protein
LIQFIIYSADFRKIDPKKQAVYGIPPMRLFAFGLHLTRRCWPLMVIATRN